MYNATLDGHEVDGEAGAIGFAGGICSDWEYRNVDKLPLHRRHIGTVNGIDVYYDYGADYYFFTSTVLLDDEDDDVPDQNCTGWQVELSTCQDYRDWHISWITVDADGIISAWEPDNTCIYTGEVLNDACIALNNSKFDG